MATAELPDGRPLQRHAVVFGLYPGDPTFYTIVERAPEVGGAPGTAVLIAWLPPGVRHYVEERNATPTFSFYRFRHGGFGFDFGEPTAWYRARPVAWNGEIPLPPREPQFDLDLVLDQLDGSVDIVTTGDRTVKSIAWSWSLSGYPSTATQVVAADANGDALVEDAFTLFNGQTGYVRVNFYSALGGLGILLGSLRASVTYISGHKDGRGQVILNCEFDEGSPGEGSYWATDTTSTGVADSETPSVGAGVDFDFDGDDQSVLLVQVVDDDDDITKAITV